MTWNGQSWIHDSPTYSSPVQFLYTPSGLTYLPTKLPNGQQGQAYTLAASGTQGPEATFRNLTPSHIWDGPASVCDASSPSYNTSYTLDPVGEFDGTKLAAEFSNALNWLPENTYVPPPVVLRYSPQGHSISPITLLPTTNTAGYIQQPPLALTTLKAAEQLKGTDIISTIRVRVAGNITPDDAGWKRVTQVAQEIEQRTGLHVLVTLGSSPTPTLISIPGYPPEDIAPVGWVEERWISIGVGLTYLNQLGQTQALLLSAVLLVCLGYLWVTLSSLVASQRRELAMLSALGWRPWHPVGAFLMQVLVLSLGGGMFGIVVALLIVALIGASPPWLIVAWTLPAVLGLALMSALYPLWQIWRIAPAEALRSGAGVTAEHTSRLGHLNAAFWARLPAVGGMALRNLARSRWRAVIAIGSLFLSAILLTVMVDGILTFHQALQGTLLGNYILLQTAVPQIVGAVFAVLLTFLSVADLLLLQVHERRKEIGLLQAVGWRPTIVQRLFVQEGLTLALLGTVPGVVVALWVLSTQHATSNTIPALVVAVGAVVIMLFVAGLATIPAVRAVNRLSLSDLLRTE